MADADIKIIVGADVQNAVNGIKQLNLSLADAESLLKDLKNERLNIVDDNQLRASNVAIKNVEQSIKNLKNAGTSGFDALGNAAKGTLGPLNEAYGAIRKLAYAIPGIGIAGLIGGGIGLLTEVITQLAGASTGAEVAQKLLTSTLNQGAASAQKEASEVQALGSIVLDESKSRDLRTKAFKELQAEYPGYFGNLSLEKSSLDKIKLAIDGVTGALIRQAQIKGLEGAISKLFEKQAEEASKNLKESFGDASLLDELIVLFKGAGGAANAVTGILDVQASKAKNAADGIKLLNDKLKELIETSLKEGDAQNLHPGKSAAIDEGKARLRILEDIKRVQDEIDKPSTAPIFKQEQGSDPVGINARVLEQKIAEAIQGGIKDPKNADVFNELADTLKRQLQKTLSPDLHVPIRFDFESEGKTEDPSKALEKIFGKLDKTAALHLTIAGFNQDEVAARLKDAQALADKLNAIFTRGVANAAQGFGDALGSAIANGVNPIKAAGDAILTAIGDLIQAAGKALIEYGIVKTGIDKILGAGGIAIPGVTAIALGVAALAIGSLVKNLGKSHHAFAEGGIVTGPTLGLVGEAGPEVIFPLDRLNQFVKSTRGGASEMTIKGTVNLKGRDLAIAISRDNKLQGLVN